MSGDQDEVGCALGDIDESGGDDGIARIGRIGGWEMGSGGVAKGVGEVGEDEGASVEVAEFAGFFDEALDGGKGDRGIDCFGFDAHEIARLGRTIFYRFTCEDQESGSALS